ncbi:hypothetical protein BBJ29_007032 [Phytophthora kernoviae]|uniref:Vms1-associating treble clef domain-containing protein n=1 Tax=Phytophthora kernoviae TaxID=325452 RepID=A0A3R7J046_9STRA|nr:hypothetical protein BBJ29_007032 [Phytophthora kernoviae]
MNLLTVTTFPIEKIDDKFSMGLAPKEQSERIAKVLEAELMFGIDNGSAAVMYPGAIYQQIHSNDTQLHAKEHILAQGLALVQAQTHAPLYLSFTYEETSERFAGNFAKLEQSMQAWIRALLDAGAEPKKLVICHADRWCHGHFGGPDYAFLLKLFALGVSVLFDMVGLLTVSDVALINPYATSEASYTDVSDQESQEPPPDSRLVNWVSITLRNHPDYLEQMLLSTNVHQRIQYRRYGGGGYTYLFETFKQRLLCQNITETQWDQIVRGNVVELLAWYEPPEAPPIPKNYLQCSICSNYFEPIEGEYFTKFAFVYCGTKWIMSSVMLSKSMRRVSASALRRPTGSFMKYHVGLLETQLGAEALAKQKENLRTQGSQSLSLDTPVFQVFGSNTDIGKTIISAGICRSAATIAADNGGRVEYIKPLQTGTDDELPGSFPGDASFVTKHAVLTDKKQGALECSTLFSWKTPVSPHLAAQMEGHTITDEELLKLLSDKLKAVNTVNGEKGPNSLVLVETAGGVCSPSASMRPQVDVYRGLRLPVVLVGDGKLGGISTTMSALETLLIRGYDVAAICLIEQDGLDNKEALEPRASELGIPIFSMNAVPPMPEPLDKWFAEHDDMFVDVNKTLKAFHQKRLQSFKNMGERAEQIFWWPFTQHKSAGGLSMIDSAHGDEFSVFRPGSNTVEPQFDACASWWTQGVGHGNAKMATSLAYAAGRYGHVMFPENAHEPALQLSERLLETVGKGWASRVYFSDDGSTAVEVALKMAFRKFVLDHGLDYSTFTSDGPKAAKMVTLAQANCYHGDTLGVMNVAEKSVFNAKQHPWYRPEGVFLKVPTVALREGEYVISIDPEIAGNGSVEEKLADLNAAFDASRDKSDLAGVYRKHVARMIDDTEAMEGNIRVGSALIEPVLMGSGGMFLVDPLYQRMLVQECRARKIPVIYDEVFSGWWRLGSQSARDLLGINPDISCYAKLLTGGVVPMAVTLASEEVFNTFYADSKGDALLHGHSFTAYPMGCAAAVTALDMYQIFNNASGPSKDVTRGYWDVDALTELSTRPYIARTFAIGTVACVELASENTGYASTEAAELIQVLRKNGVYARSLGNVLYMMCSPLTTQEDCNRYLATLIREIEILQAKK